VCVCVCVCVCVLTRSLIFLLMYVPVRTIFNNGEKESLVCGESKCAII
jgi:hypothetical protein